MTKEKPHVDAALADKLSSKVARQQIMAAGRLDEVAGADIYSVAAGWECEQLKVDPKVAKAASVTQFEAAVRDLDCATILIPREAALTMEMVKRVLERNGGQPKAIFWEA